MTSITETTEVPPILWLPGWAVPVYLELEVVDGTDALQRAILCLMQAGVPGVAGSLASQLCLEETIVESVLKALGEGEWIRWNKAEEGWRRTTKEEDAETEVERRLGWVFWDSLRGRLLPELLLDDHGADLKASAENTPANDVLNSDDFQRPKTSHIGAELIPIAEGREFSIRFLHRRGSGSRLERISDRLRRVSVQRGNRRMRWHPLAVPYRVEANLGANPSIYCGEPIYSLQLSDASPYSPYLRATIEENMIKAYQPIRDFAEKLQSRERTGHGAGFLAKMGGSERIDAEARNTVLRMLGGTLPKGPFSAHSLFNAAEDAERIWLTMAALPQSSESLRTQYSRILQVLATCLSDEMLPLWQKNPSARRAALNFPSSWDAGKRKLDFENVKQRWDGEVRRFSKRHGLSFDTWGINTAGEMKSAATFDRRRTQLGIVLRSWAAFAIAAESDPDGSFVLAWISESLAHFPNLFAIFEAVKEQRNLDKGRNFDNVPIHEYRDGIYKIWKAIAEGYSRAANQCNP